MRSKAVELVQLRAQGFCRRPPSIRDLKATLRTAHENASQRQRLESAQEQLDVATRTCYQMIGGSSPLQQVYDLVRRVANVSARSLSPARVVPAKRLIAQAIHNLGFRAGKPCGAIPETLIEAELFGHDKGAFTETVGQREGYFEKVGEGTLFLDEIGELSLAVQVKLLRILQQREFCRLGGSRLIPLKPRLMFATQHNLAKMVTQGKLRQDLFYRINVMGIDAPPLQDDPGDIPVIASHFLHRYSEEYGKLVGDFDPGAIALLKTYSWLGNLCELENVVQRAIIIAQGTCIRIEDLPRHIQDEGVANIAEYRLAARSSGSCAITRRSWPKRR